MSLLFLALAASCVAPVMAAGGVSIVPEPARARPGIACYAVKVTGDPVIVVVDSDIAEASLTDGATRAGSPS